MNHHQSSQEGIISKTNDGDIKDHLSNFNSLHIASPTKPTQQLIGPRPFVQSNLPASSPSSIKQKQKEQPDHQDQQQLDQLEQQDQQVSSSINNNDRQRSRTDSFFGIDLVQEPSSLANNHQNDKFIQSINRPSSFYGLANSNNQSTKPISNNLQRQSSNLETDSLDQQSNQLHHSQSYQAHYNNHLSSNNLHLSTNVNHHQLNKSHPRLSSVPNPRNSSRDPTIHLDPNSTFISPTPLLDNSHLKPGAKAKLLDHTKTLELYRANAKKTNNSEVLFEFSCFLLDLVNEMNIEIEDERSINDHSHEDPQRRSVIEHSSKSSSSGSKISGIDRDKDKEKSSLTQEAIGLLQKLANRGHVQSQFLLADCYTKGIGTSTNSNSGLSISNSNSPISNSPINPSGPDPLGSMASKGSKQDYDRAFPLFVLAAKHGHVESMYRAGQCCEFGWGTRKEREKAIQFYRKAAIAQHPQAMYRLGLVDLNGDLGQPRKPKDGVKWLKRAAEMADATNPKPLHELALLHERGLEHVVFIDFDYAIELLARAAELGYAPSAYKLGECYEYGRLGCPQDSALSIHYYNIAAQQNHKEACFALTAWYLVGSAGVLPQSDREAFLWAQKAAESGLAKAEYAVGYFTEVGIGTTRNEKEALYWFKKAAEHGDKRAKDRLKKVSGADLEIKDEKDSKARGTRQKNQTRTKLNEEVSGPRLDHENGQNNLIMENDGKKGKEECIIV
ncbi:hypothetical protein O181_016425 [Austropuccinia psidii MF-1]|uniref:HCP-like protein n=1 Tax=Austropuccinia psidii MF-1 TaxID=1389203 RepID=A0A9Q3GRY4_9BASI|nr:hypothetical protein [Austropuccinia psidii MF-1]